MQRCRGDQQLLRLGLRGIRSRPARLDSAARGTAHQGSGSPARCSPRWERPRLRRSRPGNCTSEESESVELKQRAELRFAARTQSEDPPACCPAQRTRWLRRQGADTLSVVLTKADSAVPWDLARASQSCPERARSVRRENKAQQVAMSSELCGGSFFPSGECRAPPVPGPEGTLMIEGGLIGTSTACPLEEEKRQTAARCCTHYDLEKCRLAATSSEG